MADSNITKSALASALKELMETTPFAKITVSDICAKCNMNRKSFYYHFRDKFDLVNWIFDVEYLTKEIFEKCRDYAREDGMKRANIGPGHMYTYITPVFICNTCEDEAKKALRKCRIYQSFHFSLHGWMDFHTAVLEVDHNKITTNRSGKCVEKVMKNVLFQKKRRRVL